MEGSLLNSNLLGSSIFGRSGNFIKSVQRGLITLGNGADAPYNVSISSVDVDQCAVRVTHYNTDDGTSGSTDGDYISVSGKLTSSTNLSFTVGDDLEETLDAIYISYEIIEFESNVTVQRGTINILYTSDDGASNITPVDYDRTFVIFNYRVHTDRTGHYVSYIMREHLDIANDRIYFTKDDDPVDASGFEINWYVITV
jgi:hypothetical protein